MNSTRRYLTNYGGYPCQIAVRPPTGIVHPTLHVRDDILTVNEIDCRQNYPCKQGLQTVVDILKLDTEGAEVATVSGIDSQFCSRIDRIFLEADLKEK